MFLISIKMFVITKYAYENNNIEIILDINDIIAEWNSSRKKLGYKNLVVIARKYCLDYSKHIFELVDNQKSNHTEGF